MTGSELIDWIVANHAEQLPVVCEQLNDSYPGLDVNKAEIVRVKYGGGSYAKANDPVYRRWEGDEKDVIWLRCD